MMAVARYLDIRLRLNLDKPADRWIAGEIVRIAEERGVPLSRVVWSALRDCAEGRAGAAGRGGDGERAGRRRAGGPPARREGSGPAQAVPDQAQEGGDARDPAPGEADIIDRLASLGTPPEPD
jgi:hypothetical protein